MAMDKVKFLSEVEVNETLTADKDIVVKQGAEIEGSLSVKNDVKIGGVGSNQGANLLVNGEITSRTKGSIKAWHVANGVVTFNNILNQLSTGKLYKLTVSAKRNMYGYEEQSPQSYKRGVLRLGLGSPSSECSTIIQFKNVDGNGTEFYIGKLPCLEKWAASSVPEEFHDSQTHFPESCGIFKHMDAYVRIYDTSDETDTENKGAFKLILRDFGSSFVEHIFNKKLLEAKISGGGEGGTNDYGISSDNTSYDVTTTNLINGNNYSIEITPLN